MTATEANQIKPIFNSKEYEKIIYQIKKAAEAGEKRLLVYERDKLSDALIDKLRLDGYKVEADYD